MPGVVIEQESIKRMRDNLRLSQEKLSALSGVSREHISRLEHGHSEAKVGTLKRLTVAFIQRRYQLIAEVSNDRRI